MIRSDHCQMRKYGVYLGQQKTAECSAGTRAQELLLMIMCVHSFEYKSPGFDHSGLNYCETTLVIFLVLFNSFSSLH